MKIQFSKFDDLIRTYDLRPICKEERNGVTLTLAEGYRRADDKMDQDHWVVTWAVFRGDIMDATKTIRIPAWIQHETFPTFQSKQEDRVRLAKEDAYEWINLNLERERY